MGKVDWPLLLDLLLRVVYITDKCRPCWELGVNKNKSGIFMRGRGVSPGG